MLEWILKFLMKIGLIKKFLIKVGHIGVKEKLISGEEIREVLNKVQPGDAILVRSYGEVTTLLMGGEFTHVLLKAEDPNCVIDVTGKLGLKKRDILNSFIGISNAIIRRPKLPLIERLLIAKAGEDYLQHEISYDYSFSSSNKEEMYCSEYYYHCYNEVNPMQLELRDRFGFMTITPDDIANCDRLFETI